MGTFSGFAEDHHQACADDDINIKIAKDQMILFLKLGVLRLATEQITSVSGKLIFKRQKNLWVSAVFETENGAAEKFYYVLSMHHH